MSLWFRVHPTTRLVLMQQEGAFSPRAWDDVALQLLTTCDPDGTCRVLADRRRSNESFPAPSDERIVRFIGEHADELGEIKWAVVVPGETAAFDAAHLARGVARGDRVHIRVFADIPGAVRWLLGVYEEPQVEDLTRWVEDPRATEGARR